METYDLPMIEQSYCIKLDIYKSHCFAVRGCRTKWLVWQPLLMPTASCRRGEAEGRCFVEGALPCQGSTAFLALRSNPRFFFWLYRNFFPFFTIFLQFSLFYGILPCFTQNNTVIISAFLQLFPIIYKFYGKTAFCKKLFTVILFERLPPPRRQLCNCDLFF